MKTVVITLTPTESKRLLGKATAALPAVQQAYQHGRLVVAGGTTNAFVLEELIGEPVDKGSYTAGVITEGVACITDAKVRQNPAVFVEGERVDRPWLDVLKEFTADDVFLKGANAIDMNGDAGILLAGPMGGTIGQAIGHLSAVGANLIMPVGLEKLIPSVRDAALVLGQKRVSDQWGMACGLMVVSIGDILTEVEALEWLFDVSAVAVSAGGVAGSEGAITLAVTGEDEDVNEVLDLVKQLKQEPNFTIPKRFCGECPAPCSRVR